MYIDDISTIACPLPKKVNPPICMSPFKIVLIYGMCMNWTTRAEMLALLPRYVRKCTIELTEYLTERHTWMDVPGIASETRSAL